MKLESQKSVYLGDITYSNETDTLKHIERCGRLCYRSEPSKDSKRRFNILNAWLDHNHTSLYEHSQIVLNVSSISIYIYAFMTDLFKSGLYRFFDLDKYNDDYLIAGNLRAWLEAYNTIGKYNDNGLIFAGIKAALPNFLSHWECGSNPDLIVPFDSVPRVLRRHAAFIHLDRGVLAEWTRHDFGFSVESSRYCNYSKDKYGGEIEIHDQDIVGFDPKDGTRDSEEKARMTWINACNHSEKAYIDMLKYVKPDIARQVLNMSLMTRMHVSGLPWYWDNFFKLRNHSAAHANIRYLAKQLQESMEEHGYRK